MAGLYIHTQYTHTTHTLHTQYTHSTHTVHTHYTHTLFFDVLDLIAIHFGTSKIIVDKMYTYTSEHVLL